MRDAYPLESEQVSPGAALHLRWQSGRPWGGQKLRPTTTHANGTGSRFSRAGSNDGWRGSLGIADPTASIDTAIRSSSTKRRRGRPVQASISRRWRCTCSRSIEQLGADGISDIRRVIFDVGLQAKLAATSSGSQVIRRLAFSKQQAWVRHHEHYHVDFGVVPCQ